MNYPNINRADIELESIDKDLCEKLGSNRYKIIRIDSRTRLTSIGLLIFRRKYVFYKIKSQYGSFAE